MTTDDEARIEQQLERLFTRFEFNEGFEVDIIAPKTWAAQWWARLIIERRLVGTPEFEALEISSEGLETARQSVADVILARTTHRILVIQMLDDDGDTQRWQPFFRRLNEVRNAIIREFSGNLVLLLAPSLLTEFIGEAPDLWSVSAVVSVGCTEPEELVDAMARRYSVLEQLTLMSVEDIVGQLRAHHLSEFVDIIIKARTDRCLRARRVFELLGSALEIQPLPRPPFDGLIIELDGDALAAEVPYVPVGMTHSVPTRPRSTFLRRMMALLDGLILRWIRLDFSWDDMMATVNAGTHGIIWISDDLRGPIEERIEDGTRFIFHLIPCPGSPQHRDLEALIRERQSASADRGIHIRCCAMHESHKIDAAEVFARRNFDLLVTIPPDAHHHGWHIEPGTRMTAPRLSLARNIKVEIFDGCAVVRGDVERIQIGGPRQPWLPGLDPAVLGVVPLYREESD